jgi:hypothetical protein
MGLRDIYTMVPGLGCGKVSKDSAHEPPYRLVPSFKKPDFENPQNLRERCDAMLQNPHIAFSAIRCPLDQGPSREVLEPRVSARVLIWLSLGSMSMEDCLQQRMAHSACTMQLTENSPKAWFDAQAVVATIQEYFSPRGLQRGGGY